MSDRPLDQAKISSILGSTMKKIGHPDRTECEHGSLKRKCVVCELTADLAAVRADLAEAVAALKSFAERAVYYAQRTSDDDDESTGVAALGDFRRAARIVQKHAPANT